jgi:hypothetical protein
MVKYRTPFTINGVALIEPADPGTEKPSRNTHAKLKEAMSLELI